ncbi:virion structural protein [Salmonella phage SPAsTU]|nr:putative virion structural protein 5 [Salmonella phage STsAS]AWN09046.1 virion structural protein [Salmonella phage SPAsTU]
MPIPNMLAMLLPSFEATNLKNQLSSNCDSIAALEPQFTNLQELVGSVQGKPFKAKPVAELSTEMVKYLRGSGLDVKGLREPSMLEYVVATMQNVQALRPFLEQCIDRDIGKTLVTSSLTFNKQTVLQMLDMIEFFVGYAGTLINYITAEEIAAIPGSNIAVKGIGPKDLQYLQTRKTSFCIAVRVLATPIAKLKADYAEIPEAVFDEDTYNDLVQQFGSSTTDPLGMSSVPFPLSIIYRVRLNIAEWQMDRYDECVEAAKATELRILLYKKQQAAGEGDVHIEKLIEAHEKRLMELKYKRERLEKKYGLA